MKKILYTSLLATLFFACGPSAEEMEEHEKKVETEELKLPDEFEQELESMGMQADSSAADTTKK
jgi:hypothetical protein